MKFGRLKLRKSKMSKSAKYQDYYNVYDKVVLKMLPFYPEMHQTMINLINRSSKDEINVLEPGFGTGTLTYLIFQKFPQAKILGIDNSSENINKAKQKLVKFSGFDYWLGNIQDFHFNQKFDIVISALAIHHLSDKEKQQYLLEIFKTLKTGGRFIIGDIVKSEDEKDWHDYLVKEMGKEGEYRWKVHKSNPNDMPSTLESQLGWLKEAGFTKVKAVKKWFNFYVFYGEK